ncbi:MAG TPA: CRISPR-associated endonuclease Cas2 [Paludibaculum sp.]|jgi:CRISPR-associated protein Cas2
MKCRDLYVAAYDITTPKRLREALKILKGYSCGGQKSVFECFLTPAEKSVLLREIGETVDPAEDRFLLVRLDPRSRVQAFGIAVPPKDPPFFYVS